MQHGTNPASGFERFRFLVIVEVPLHLLAKCFDVSPNSHVDKDRARWLVGVGQTPGDVVLRARLTQELADESATVRNTKLLLSMSPRLILAARFDFPLDRNDDHGCHSSLIVDGRRENNGGPTPDAS